ncbi:hypothetical protein DCCM_2126 [Desulfocucumis palustris]|uniref:Uncharacterized protein n=1 Tax=Desulfocucumis palustris TaxID=1898651 RepID=A0A2L2X9U9_9FIRM|nr:hypothetical protein DCCM_2126 [Desulfocucumis palustris]
MLSGHYIMFSGSVLMGLNIVSRAGDAFPAPRLKHLIPLSPPFLGIVKAVNYPCPFS